jgi:hypothetical protein
VIPAMDRIAALLKSQTKKKIHPTIALALNLARKKMDQYYSLTDSSSLYWIAMGAWSVNDAIGGGLMISTSQFYTPA